jgi:hypothetical protein
MKINLFYLFSLIIGLFVTCSISFPITASNNFNPIIEDKEVFDFDESEIYSSFSEIDDLTSYLNDNETVSFSELSAINSPLIENVNADAAIVLNTQDKLTPPIFGAFLWGCCYGPIGILVVAVCTSNDKDQIRQAANGCIVFHVTAAILYGIFYLLMYAYFSF